MSIINVTKETFEEVVLKSDKPVLVDFFTHWCGDCKRISPVLDVIAEKNTAKLIVAKVDCEAEPELKTQYDIMAYPTLYVFKNGKHDTCILEPSSKAQIDEFINSQIG